MSTGQTNDLYLTEMASMAKLHNAEHARRVVAEARDLLGGNGILLENEVGRHWATSRWSPRSRAPTRCTR